MSQKRQQTEEGTSLDDKRLRKSHSFRRVVLDVMNLLRMQNLMNPLLEPLLRRVVREEVDSALRKYIISMKRNCAKDINPSESRCLQLKFSNAISLPVFTGTRIEGEGCTNMEVALVDALTGSVVSDGLVSSAKVEILVLEGDFDGDEGENWTIVEFKNNVVKEREGKKPLLTGDVILTLKEGTGLVGDLSFTDNSSWTRSRKFRLGARLMDDIGGVRVREARSEPFIVRDHRGESYKKHHPPSLTDEVWRLEKIGKDGAFHKRLSKERIKTVQDFLISLSLDPTRLRNILGAGMSAKKWEVTLEHARTCVLDKTLYLYSASISPENNGVVFNVVGQVMGILSNGQYIAIDKLSEAVKVDAHKLVISAFADRGKIVTLDESSLNIPSTSSCLSETPNLLSESSHHQHLSTPDFMQSLYSIEGSSSFNYYLHGVDDEMEMRYDQSLSFPTQLAESLICDTDSMARAFCANENFFENDCSLQSSDFELSAGLCSAEAIVPCSVTTDNKAKKGWNILACVLRWRFSIKRIVARKTRVGPIPEYGDAVGGRYLS